MSRTAEDSGAEGAFREAFERLKAGRPVVLKAGAGVSQNNVAKEAGRDPSALRKSRYLSLVLDIQAYAEATRQKEESANQRRRNAREAQRSLEARLRDLVAQRDDAQSQLLSARRALVDLLLENQSLKERLREGSREANDLSTGAASSSTRGAHP
jgi:chromosome segregation ATPase